MNSSHQTLFKIRKSSWGIIITLNIEVRELSNNKRDLNLLGKVNNNLFIDFSNTNLPLHYKEKIVDGLKWVAESIKVNSGKLLYIRNILYNHSDFQEEGLFFAAAQWASEYFDFELPYYEFTYDSRENKYLFTK